MRRFILPLSVFGLLLLTACGKGAGFEITNSNGKVVGTISVQGPKSATFLSISGSERGKVRGNIVRDDAGKNLGTIVEGENGRMMLQDGKEDALGNLDNGTDCYGKGQDKLGTISQGVDTSVAAGACLVFFLQ